MRGIAELLIDGAWRLLPKLQREELSRKILAFQARAQRQVPPSGVKVYAFSHPSVNLFSGLLSGISEEKLAIENCISAELPAKFPAYSLVTTCRDEAKSIRELLESVSHQTVPPGEHIIVDGGSSDRTVALIREWEEKQGGMREGVSFSRNIIEEGPLSISRGRNRGVQAAKYDIILFTDAGVTLDRHWAERLILPFVQDPGLEVSMGWYEPVLQSGFQKALAYFLVPRLSNVDPETFLPSARSVAMRKDVFERTGGYPEHLTLAGEDSLFDLYLKTCTRRLAFVPDAIAYWKFPTSFWAMAGMVRNYARGDAEGGMLFWYYYLLLFTTISKLFAETALFFFVFCLWLCSGWTFLFALSFVAFLSPFIRGILLVRGYSPWAGQNLSLRLSLGQKLDRLCALALLMGGQYVGFVQGLRSRKQCEQRRIGKASTGHVVLLLRDFPSYDEQSGTTQRIVEHLKSGWYVTAIYPQHAEEGTAKLPAYEHPQLETHVRSAFVFDAWLETHMLYLKRDDHAFQCVDLCGDSWSKDLAGKFERRSIVG